MVATATTTATNAKPTSMSRMRSARLHLGRMTVRLRQLGRRVQAAGERSYRTPMERTPVESKALRSIGYDSDARVLELEFPGRKVYQYLDVSPELHAWLMRSKDKMAVFRNKIDGCFEVRRVDHIDPNAPSLEDALRASLAASHQQASDGTSSDAPDEAPGDDA